ncbi:MAG TPA: beta-ketoacyl synthase N-terminal-like domain-containing protein [Verrucomicrobiae bacterium]|jgi:3-oxoacyl-(acyl-carrier-protein) synthase
MNKIAVTTTSIVTEADLAAARLGPRFGRLDLQSRLALLAVAALKIDFAGLARDRVGICLAASASSLTTDVNFWQGRNGIGGPSPTLFAYTLPSAAVGEIAIHFGLTGPNLCFVADETILKPEATDLIQRGEADYCVGVYCHLLSAEAAEITNRPAAAVAHAFFMARGSEPQ